MKKSNTFTKHIFFVIFVAIIISSLLSCKNQKKTDFIVLAAASLTDVCAELKTEFEKENPQINVLFSFGGSGALQAQIEAGVPCDFFISAATKQMTSLLKKDLIDKESVKNLLENEIVLITHLQTSGEEISSFEELTLPSVKMIAMGEPSSVPVGQYSKAIFDKLGIWDKVSKKMNYASDVRTVLNWVEEKSCDYGIVYKTDAFVSKKIRVVASAPKGSHPKVIYPVGIVNASEKKAEAQKFENFLFSKNAAEIFSKAGFTISF